MENNKDNFYQDRYEQIKNDLLIGDEKHTLGKPGSYHFLYRLFEEVYSFEEIFSILENVHRNAKQVNKCPICCFDNITKAILKKNHTYIIVDSDDKMKTDYWTGERFNKTENPKYVMLHADANEFDTYIAKK